MVLPTIGECTSPLLPKHEAMLLQYDRDLEDTGSDTTRVSASAPSAAAKLLRRSSSWELPWSRSSSPRRMTARSTSRADWVRWGVVVALQTTMIALVAWPRFSSDGEIEAVLRGKKVETGDDINGLYRTGKDCPSRLPASADVQQSLTHTLI